MEAVVGTLGGFVQTLADEPTFFRGKKKGNIIFKEKVLKKFCAQDLNSNLFLRPALKSFKIFPGNDIWSKIVNFYMPFYSYPPANLYIFILTSGPGLGLGNTASDSSST